MATLKSVGVSLDSSPVAAGSGNVQTPVQIGQARDVTIVHPHDSLAPRLPNTNRAASGSHPLPNIQLVRAEIASCAGMLQNLVELGAAQNVAVIRFANEPRPNSQNTKTYVKAVLIYRDRERELLDITGSWLPEPHDVEEFDAEGRRHTLIAGVRSGNHLIAVTQEKISKWNRDFFVPEIRTLPNSQEGVLFVRLTNASNGAVLYEGQFALSTAPFTIAPAPA